MPMKLSSPVPATVKEPVPVTLPEMKKLSPITLGLSST